MPESDRKQLDFEALAQSLRPKLHRYCARMAGSSIDGEDIVQDALLKAMQAFPGDGSVADPEAWLFRIAHNTALDFLRRRVRLLAVTAGEPEETIADPSDEIARHQVAAMGLRPFMKLSPAERSSIILMDVIGYSLREVGAIMNLTVPAVKAALHRGRTRLAALAGSLHDDTMVALTDREHERLAYYVERFNARDFDAVRDLLAEDVRLDLINRRTLKGKSGVANYFSNYAGMAGWHLAAGMVEGRPAVLSYQLDDAAKIPSNFILLDWDGDKISHIRDFYYAEYVKQVAGTAVRLTSPA
jgi:RNA polymerase sigma-70 factor (ECF subfamily)